MTYVFVYHLSFHTDAHSTNGLDIMAVGGGMHAVQVPKMHPRKVTRRILYGENAARNGNEDSR